MKFLHAFAVRLLSLFRERQLDSDSVRELESHLQLHVDDNLRAGMSPDEARRSAVLKLGGLDQTQQRCRDQRVFPFLESLLQDLRFAVRALIKSPGFTTVAIFTLALGIGANSAIFTLINQVMLRKLPVRDPKQLVAFGDSLSAGVAGGIDLGGFGGYFPWDFARQLEQNPGPFQGIAAYGSFSSKVTIGRRRTAGPSEPSLLASANLVSGNYFTLLGAQPLIGRTILPADDAVPASGAVAVVSFRFWQKSLSSDAAIVGRTLSINGTSFEVVGVMRPSFHSFKQDFDPTDLWTPISMQPVILQQPSMLMPHSGLYFLHLFGRLSPRAASSKVALAESQSWLNRQIQSATRANEGASVSPERQQEIARIAVPLVPGTQGVSLIRNQYGDSLEILMAVVGVVLLIACANLANSLMARGATRRREIATRLALGSTRSRIIRQSLTETLLLSAVGSGLGLVLAFVATRALIAFVIKGPGDVALSPLPDLSVLLFTLSVALVTTVLFGLAPSVLLARIDSRGSLNSSVRTAHGGGGKSSRFWPKTLVASQVTLSLLLLIGAGLLLRTLSNLQNQDYGFERSQLLIAQFDESLAHYQPHQAVAVHQLLLERLFAIPGVRSVALSATPPISNGAWSSNISPAGYTPAPRENMVSILNRVSGRYFETTGISIIAGRPITDADISASPKVAVVSESIARRYYPGGQAIGHDLTIGIDSVAGPWQIVGIARDTKSGNPRDSDPVRMTYIPLAQIDPFPPMQPGDSGSAADANPGPREENGNCYANTILLRTAGDPAKTTADLRTAVASVNPDLPLLNITTIQDQVSSLIANDELISALMTSFSLLALLLAAIGLYGVTSYNVIQRTTEIGVRMALGAQLKTVLWMILKESLTLLTIGVGLGLPLAVLATRSIKNQLFGLSAIDPATFGIAIGIVSTMILLATWLPARRATRVDPVIALRYE